MYRCEKGHEWVGENYSAGAFEAPYCQRCGWRSYTQHGQLPCVGHPPDATKPAPTEPPEWKGFVNRSILVAGKLVPIADEVLPPAPSPLDRAIEGFIERRKAKRESYIPDPTPICEKLCHRMECHRNGCRHTPYSETNPFAKGAPALSRAMSTPLPHDPDIHTRVMPWRGKE